MALRHNVIEQVVEGGIDKLIEKLEQDHQNGKQSDRDCGGRDSLQDWNNPVQPECNLIVEPDQHQTGTEERRTGKNERDSSSPAAAAAVALHADVWSNRHAHQIRNGRKNHSHQPVRALQILEMQRNNARHHRFHQRKTEIPPEQPDKQHGESCPRIGQGSTAEKCLLRVFRGRFRRYCTVHFLLLFHAMPTGSPAAADLDAERLPRLIRLPLIFRLFSIPFFRSGTVLTYPIVRLKNPLRGRRLSRQSAADRWNLSIPSHPFAGIS